MYIVVVVINVAQLLGYPADSKLLIIHADDVGMCRSVNRATFLALEEGGLSSASVMVPCQAFPEAAEYFARHPEFDIGIHSTLISEHPDYKWGPVSAKPHRPEMVDAEGHFWPHNGLLRASPAEVEDEISAQLILAKQSGIRPTHIDSHTFSVARPEYIPAYINVARKFELPFLITEHWHSYCSPDDPATAEDTIVDDVFQAGRDLAPFSLENFYLSVLRQVKAGLSQLIVHPAFDDPEMRAIYKDREAYGAAWRQRDFEIMCSQKFKSAIHENGIQVVNWGMIRSAVQSRGAARPWGSHGP
jgi:hypothetical protein